MIEMYSISDNPIFNKYYYTSAFSACRWSSFIKFKILIRKYLKSDKNITEKI